MSKFKQLKKEIKDKMEELQINLSEFVEEEEYKKIGFNHVVSSPHYNGENCHTIIEKIVDGEKIYIRFDGRYASQEGAEYDKYSQVHPFTITEVYYG